MKATFHKSCNCFACRAGRGSKAGQATKVRNERKLRRKSKLTLDAVVKGQTDDAEIAPITSPYTD